MYRFSDMNFDKCAKESRRQLINLCMVRLTRQANNCGDSAKTRKNIFEIKLLTNVYRSNRLRRKLLEMGKTLTLEDIQRIARSMEG